MLGIVIGSFEKYFDFSKLEKKIENINNKQVELFISEKCYFIPRHGIAHKIPPHLIDYRTNILAMTKNNVDKIISFSVCGSLKKEIVPGQIVIPDDFIRFNRVETFNSLEVLHVVPKIDEGLRKKIIEICKQNHINYIDKATYMNVTGPSLETKAEIKMYSCFADIIGMTMAYEATFCNEIGVPFGAVCPVSNYGNGIGEEELSQELIEENIKKMMPYINKLIDLIVAHIK